MGTTVNSKNLAMLFTNIINYLAQFIKNIFDFFGEFSEEEIQQRYNNNQFLPCSINKWQLSEAAYRVAIKAVSPDRNERYLTFAEFWNEWKKAL